MSVSKKPLLLILIVLCIMALPTMGFGAIDFSFSYVDPDGWDSTGLMTIDVSGDTMTVTVDNTSSTMFDGKVMAPGITGFGFDIIEPLSQAVSDWTLEADIDGSGNTMAIAEMTGLNNDWNLLFNENFNGITVDYTANTNDGVKGALYNPDVINEDNYMDALGGPPRYFTTATLSLTFDADIFNVLDTDNDGAIDLDDNTSWYSFLRMQNVGPNGQYSTKLWDDGGGGGGGGSAVPEPATMILMGMGLIGIGFGIRKKTK